MKLKIIILIICCVLVACTAIIVPIVYLTTQSTQSSSQSSESTTSVPLNINVLSITDDEGTPKNQYFIGSYSFTSAPNDGLPNTLSNYIWQKDTSDDDGSRYILLTNNLKWKFILYNEASDPKIRSTTLLTSTPDVVDPSLYDGEWVHEDDGRIIEFLSSNIVTLDEAQKVN